MSSRRAITLLLLAPALVAVGAEAQRFRDQHGPQPVQDVPGLDEIAVDEKLDSKLPLDVAFLDHTGKKVQLRDYFDGERPVLLSFAYHTCPTLCSMVLDATTRGISATKWTAGVEYEVVTISIDPKDTPESAAKKRSEVLAQYKRPAAADGWHFLVGDEKAIEKVTSAVGYRYFYNEKTEQYGHPAAIVFLTPQGMLARYLYGLNFNPADIRLALLEASEGRSISTAEQIILYCYAYDPAANSYALMAVRVMKLGGGVTVLVLGGFLVLLWRRERRRGRSGSVSAVTGGPNKA
jgi:protein SCO1